jgi:hypothetical protein
VATDDERWARPARKGQVEGNDDWRREAGLIGTTVDPTGNGLKKELRSEEQCVSVKEFTIPIKEEILTSKDIQIRRSPPFNPSRTSPPHGT